MSSKKAGEIGWREYLALPDLGIDSIKAKVDTGALTSAIHATEIEVTTEDDQQWVDFTVMPTQFSDEVVVRCRAPLVGYRKVRNSGGVQDERAVIATTVRMGDVLREIELTLVRAPTCGFACCLGAVACPRVIMRCQGNRICWVAFVTPVNSARRNSARPRCYAKHNKKFNLIAALGENSEGESIEYSHFVPRAGSLLNQPLASGMRRVWSQRAGY